MQKKTGCKLIAYSFCAEIIKLAKGETDSQLSKITQCEQDTYEMQVRAANIGMKFIQQILYNKKYFVPFSSILLITQLYFDFSASRRITNETCI